MYVCIHCVYLHINVYIYTRSRHSLQHTYSVSQKRKYPHNNSGRKGYLHTLHLHWSGTLSNHAQPQLTAQACIHDQASSKYIILRYSGRKDDVSRHLHTLHLRWSEHVLIMPSRMLQHISSCLLRMCPLITTHRNHSWTTMMMMTRYNMWLCICKYLFVCVCVCTYIHTYACAFDNYTNESLMDDDDDDEEV
jgi:hypothetical protein